jgi:hypothetical protein
VVKVLRLGSGVAASRVRVERMLLRQAARAPKLFGLQLQLIVRCLVGCAQKYFRIAEGQRGDAQLLPDVAVAQT